MSDFHKFQELHHISKPVFVVWRLQSLFYDDSFHLLLFLHRHCLPTAHHAAALKVLTAVKDHGVWDFFTFTLHQRHNQIFICCIILVTDALDIKKTCHFNSGENILF